MRNNQGIHRLLSLVRAANECWLYPHPAPNGYGQIRINGKRTSAHRAMFELLVGPIPHGRQVDHLCRNRACFNPAHLEAVTSQVNLLRGETRAAANARKTHCPKGHSLTGENLVLSATGGRGCRECGRVRARDYQRRYAQAHGMFRSTAQRRADKPKATRRVAKKKRTYLG